MSSAGGPEGNRTPASYLDRVAVRPRTGPQAPFKSSRILKLAKRKFVRSLLCCFQKATPPHWRASSLKKVLPTLRPWQKGRERIYSHHLKREWDKKGKRRERMRFKRKLFCKELPLPTRERWEREGMLLVWALFFAFSFSCMCWGFMTLMAGKPVGAAALFVVAVTCYHFFRYLSLVLWPELQRRK